MADIRNDWQGDAATYRSFLLRCWLEGERGDLSDWRFSLVDLSAPQEKNGLACLEEVVESLSGRLSQAGPRKIHSDSNLTAQEK